MVSISLLVSHKGRAHDSVRPRGEERSMDIAKLCLAALIIGVSTISAGAVELVNPHQALERSRRANIEFDRRMKRDAAEQRQHVKEQEAKRTKEDAQPEQEKKAQEAQQKTVPQGQEGKPQKAQRKPVAGAAKSARSSSAKSAPPRPTTPPAAPSTDATEPSAQPGQP